MTAEDVVWSSLQWGQNDFQSRRNLVNSYWVDPEGSVETPDPYTIVVDTGAPIGDVLAFGFLASPSGGAIPAVSMQQTAEIGEEAANLDVAGTGPWEIAEIRAPEFWRMQAVEDHWRQTPYFAELVLWEIPEESSRIAGFQTGNLDTFIMDFDSIPVVESVPGAKLMPVSSAGPMMIQFHGNFYVGIATSEERPGYDPDLPWVSSDPDLASPEWERARKVRLALITAIDTPGIIDSILGGFGQPAVLHDYVTHEHLLDPDMKWEYDPERAGELLSEAGYPGGGFNITLTSAIRNSPAELAVCEAIASMWEAIGISVKFQRIPYGTYRPSTAARTYNGATCFGGRPPLAPVYQFSLIQTKAPISFGVEHPWLEEKASQAQAAAATAEREQLEREVARFTFDNVFGAIAIYTAHTVWPVGPRIKEWSKNVKHYDLRAINGYEFIRPRQ